MKFYITTAIDYPNSLPHMGHAYEKVVADFYARWHRLRGADVRFLTGVDEHGEKIQEAARNQGRTPQELVDERSGVFRDLCRKLSISIDDFIRTTEPRHRRFVAEIYERVAAKGDTYKGFYEGDYCVACETFYTETQLQDGKCPVHGTPTSRVKEESYFFRLGKYRDWIREHIRSHPEFVFPDERRNELLSRLEEEVRDLSISRCTFDWGIPVPGDPRHVVYVWFDALSNYISALKEPADLYDRYWPADAHVIGKDIIWFHAVIWPCMLHAAGLPLPRQVLVHGFILDREGKKMSKAIGNVVDPIALIDRYGADVLRFYCLRSFAGGQDGWFSEEELRERYASELANELGNLVMRVAKLVATKLGGKLAPRGGPADLDFAETVREYGARVDAREHHRAIEALWAYIRKTNAYITEKAPWKIAETDRLAEVLYNALEALRAITHLLEPVIPEKARAIAESLGFPIGKVDDLRFGTGTFTVTQRPPLFPRLEEEKPAGGVAAGPEAKPKKAAPPKPAVPNPTGPEPTEPFAAVEIRVGLIAEVAEHPDAESLFAMKIDLGGETRSICAGLRKHLTLDDLRGRKVAVVTNLKPAKLRGIESRGMVLATDRRDGKVVPVDPGDAPVGDPVKAEGIESTPKPRITIDEFGKAPLLIQGGRVVYRDPAGGIHPLRTSAGDLRCDAEDGATVR
jgi:methionyl-tRNA synthetase